MYELFVLACLINNPIQCVILEDLESPHKTEVECMVRAQDIRENIRNDMPMFYAKRYRCDKKLAEEKTNAGLIQTFEDTYDD